jgi:hypothetical protein
MKYLILVIVAALVCSCYSKSEKVEEQATPNQITAVPVHNQAYENEVCPDDNKSLEKMSLDELIVVNRNISARFRKDYRSWSYDEPDRWPSLADKFADCIICSCPEVSSKKKEIAQFYLDYLKKRAETYYSNAENKQALIGQLSIEFKYNLTFLLGVEGFQKWKLDSKPQDVIFNQMNDSLNVIIDFMREKYQELKKQKL